PTTTASRSVARTPPASASRPGWHGSRNSPRRRRGPQSGRWRPMLRRRQPCESATSAGSANSPTSTKSRGSQSSSTPATAWPGASSATSSAPTANPLKPENLVDAAQAVVDTGADLGLVFDGDADRCFFIDETGATMSASAIGALVAEREIARAKAAGDERPTVIHNLITSRSVPE